MVVEVQVPAPTLRRFTVDDFHRMGEAGVFAPDERVELIEGVVVEMSPIGDPHAAGTGRVQYVLAGKFGREVFVWMQNPVRLADGSEVYPDVAVHRFRADFYRSGAPTPADVLLVVEVADTSLRYDLETKAALYARHGIADYWVQDINGHRLLVHRDPTADGYRSIDSLYRGDKLRPVAFPDVELRVEELLG